ncbi:MAG TPA: GNAT family N-acetyltransferase [Actinoplanes sp.]|nr:GNAT family N-acetyltransferase [Actinoplanes sp.]
MTVLLRTVEDFDLVAVGALHHRSRTTAYAGLVSADALAAGSAAAMGEWWTERWRWERDTHRMTVAVESGRVVGFTYLGPSETAGAVELDAIHVDPDHIGTGVGRALMLDALDRLTALAGTGTDRAVLWVLPGNMRARRFYEAFGWAADGVTRDSPIGSESVPHMRYARSVRS